MKFVNNIDFLAIVCYISLGDVMNELFSHFIHSNDTLFKYARGISDRSGKEFHDFHEIIYFLDGDAEFISERLHTKLLPQTLLIIPMQTYHQMIIHGDQHRYYRCLLQFTSDISFKDITAIPGDAEIGYLISKLMTAAKDKDPDAQNLLHAVLSLLIHTLKNKHEISDLLETQNNLVRTAIAYINKNIDRKILLSDIAGACNVSASTLCHIFSREMHVSIHKFIVKKRLINARRKIATGQSATSAALECGFQDYSGFYKQYIKAFGIPPSKK